LAKTFASKLGKEPSASTSPSRGSIATNAPASAGLPFAFAASTPRATAFCAARWSPRSSVRRSWRPWIGGSRVVRRVSSRLPDEFTITRV
jgi:hypothetical protein